MDIEVDDRGAMTEKGSQDFLDGLIEQNRGCLGPALFEAMGGRDTLITWDGEKHVFVRQQDRLGRLLTKADESEGKGDVIPITMVGCLEPGTVVNGVYVGRESLKNVGANPLPPVQLGTETLESPQQVNSDNFKEKASECMSLMNEAVRATIFARLDAIESTLTQNAEAGTWQGKLGFRSRMKQHEDRLDALEAVTLHVRRDRAEPLCKICGEHPVVATAKDKHTCFMCSAISKMGRRLNALEAHNAKHFEQLSIPCKMCRERYPHEQLRGTPPICPHCHTDGRD